MRQNKGQIVVEYVLLLIIAIGLSALVVRTLVNRSGDSKGAVIQAWIGLIDFVSRDKADDIQP